MRRRPKLVLRYGQVEAPKGASKRFRRIEIGTVTKVNKNGTYDVKVGNRAFDYPGIRPIVRMKFRVGDVVLLGFLEGQKNICFILGRAKNISGDSTENLKPTVPEIPINPGLWIQHDGFWWGPARGRESQLPFDPAADAEELLNTGASETALANAINFRGLVAFPEGEDQVVATLTAVYESAGDVTSSTPITDEIEFVAEGDEDPPAHQVEGKTFVLSHEPSESLDGQEFTSFSHTPPAAFLQFEGHLFEVEATQTYGLALTPQSGYIIAASYLALAASDSTYTESFSGDGTTTDFVLFGGDVDYTTYSGATVSGPAGVISSFVDAPLVDGVPDNLATFSGNTVILSFAPDPGASIFVQVNYKAATQNIETFIGDNSTFAFTLDPAGSDTFFQILEVMAGDDNVTANAHYRSADSKLRVLALFVDDDTVAVDYTYDVVSGELFNITGLEIIEKLVVAGTTTTLEIPLEGPVSAHFVYAPDGVSKIQAADAADLGQLFFDPLTSTYTVAGPTGVHWRDRQQLADPGTHHRFTPWPDDGNSADELVTSQISNGDWLISALKRREAPWYGFCAAGKYGMQGAWNRVGGTGSGVEGEFTYASDTEFNLRLYRRTDAGVWENHQNIDVKKLCQNPNTSFPLNVIGCCSTGPTLTATPNHGRHIMSRNLAAWIVCCAWNVTDFASADDPQKQGWVDAGLTISAINPETGKILAQHTIKCDKDLELDAFVHPADDVAGDIADSAAAVEVIIDKYVNNNPAYWPPTSGDTPAAPHLGFATYAAVANFFEYPPGSNDQWFMVGRFMGLHSESATVKGYPGVPTFAAFPESVLQFFATEGGNSNNPETQMIPQILGDESNNLYLTLHKPVWARISRSVSSSTVMDLAGSVTHNWAGIGTPTPAPIYTIISTGNLLVSGGIVSATHGVVEAPSFPLASSPNFREVAWFPAVVSAGTGPPPTNEPLFTSPSDTNTIQWKSLTFNPTYATVAATYSGLPRPIEFLTFDGWQEVDQPYAGFKVVDYTIDYTWSYTTSTHCQTWIHKVNYDENLKTFTAVWAKDVSELVPEDAFEPLHHAAHPALFRFYTQVSPRGVFLLTSFFEDLATTPYINNTRVYLRVFPNGADVPSQLHRVEIPNSRVVNGVGAVSWQPHLVELDADGRERVTVVHTKDGTRYVTVVQFGEHLADDPTVTQTVVGTPDIPNPFAFPPVFPYHRLMRVGGRYVWDGPGNKIYTKPSATP